MTFVFADLLTYPLGQQISHLYGPAGVICMGAGCQMIPKDACEC